MQIQPYLTFGGRSEEAIEFYKKTLDAKVELLMHFKDSPEPMPNEHNIPNFDDLVMHATVKIGDNVIFFSDGCEQGADFKGFALSISVKTEEEANRLFEALGEGGKVTMPIGKTFWSPRFGMLTDRFGVDWMVSVEAEA